MATIFNFKPAGQSARSVQGRPPQKVCEIILFPGVRYERWADVPPPEPQKVMPTRKPRAKKRALEMAD
jgi:hypothetical protein